MSQNLYFLHDQAPPLDANRDNANRDTTRHSFSPRGVIRRKDTHEDE